MLAAMFAVTAQPLMAGVRIGKTNRQSLVGVRSNGNWSYYLGTRRGKAKVITYQGNQQFTATTIARGKVKNMSPWPQWYYNIGVWVRLPSGWRVPAQYDSVTVSKQWNSNTAYNVTTGFFDSNAQPPQPR